MNTTINFKVEFILFNKNQQLTIKQIKYRNYLLENIDTLLKSNITDYIILNDNEQLTICSNDGKKKLKLCMDLENMDELHSIFFYQCDNRYLFTFDELKNLVDKINKIFESTMYFPNLKVRIFYDFSDIHKEREERHILSNILNINYII